MRSAPTWCVAPSFPRAAPRTDLGPACASSLQDLMYFIADSDKEKEDWINAIGRAIVHHSASMCEEYAE